MLTTPPYQQSYCSINKVSTSELHVRFREAPAGGRNSKYANKCSKDVKKVKKNVPASRVRVDLMSRRHEQATGNRDS